MNTFILFLITRSARELFYYLLICVHNEYLLFVLIRYVKMINTFNSHIVCSSIYH